MTPILYGHPASGHSWKVAQALVLLGIDHRYAYVDLLVARDERRADFVAASPYGEVPVLVLDGEVLAQSNAILLALNRKTGWLGGEGGHSLDRWLFWEANRIGFSVANLRWAIRFQPDTDLGVIAMLRDRAAADLDFLERHLPGNAFICGDRLSMADIACSAYLQFADEADLSLAGYPAVRGWLARLADVPRWEHAYSLLAPERATA